MDEQFEQYADSGNGEGDEDSHCHACGRPRIPCKENGEPYDEDEE